LPPCLCSCSAISPFFPRLFHLLLKFFSWSVHLLFCPPRCVVWCFWCSASPILPCRVSS
jgi:hypothetical protein